MIAEYNTLQYNLLYYKNTTNVMNHPTITYKSLTRDLLSRSPPLPAIILVG